MKIATNQERLIELFNADPRNDTAIASELNVSKQALSAWRKGTRSPKKTVRVEIAKMYNVSLEWLMGFDVPKISPVAVETIPESDPEISIVSGMMESMSKEQKQQVIDLIKILVKKG